LKQNIKQNDLLKFSNFKMSRFILL